MVVLLGFRARENRGLGQALVRCRRVRTIQDRADFGAILRDERSTPIAVDDFHGHSLLGVDLHSFLVSWRGTAALGAQTARRGGAFLDTVESDLLRERLAQAAQPARRGV